MPLIERVTTITGESIKEPKNLITKVGTPICEIIDQCGGYREDRPIGKLIIGGPMMGNSQHTDNIVVDKMTSSILCLPQAEINVQEPLNCLR